MNWAYRIVATTFVCGVGDLWSAFALAGLRGKSPADVLRGVASGPFPSMASAGDLGAAVGTGVHFSIMAVMAAAFLVIFSRVQALRKHPIVVGAIYGVILYGVMYWIVLPLRFPEIFPQTEPQRVANALFSHVVCVGVPMGLMGRHLLGKPAD